MKNTVKAIILDWAGTTVDFGSFAPVAAFVKAFETYGITPTIEETRAPMGMQKWAHIEKMLGGSRIADLFTQKYDRPYNQEDIDAIYKEFKPALFSSLEAYTKPLPGVIKTVEKIRAMGIKIGSTTGYTRSMMDIVVPSACEKGYSPDCLVVPDEVGGVGRPYPYMLWRCLEKLSVGGIHEVIKVGDTAADIAEGKNAGCLAVGVCKGSNMLGLGEEAYGDLTTAELADYYKQTTQKYLDAGADYVIGSIDELPALILQIDERRGRNI